MSLKKYLLAGGFSTVLVLGACGGDDGAAEEEAEEAVAEESDAEAPTEDADSESIDENGSEAAEDEAAESGEEQSKTFVLDEPGVYNELVYHYVGDEVKRQSSVSEMDYITIGVENEAQARELMDDIAVTYSETEGVEHHIEYGEDSFTETLEVDYEAADLSEIAVLEGADFEDAGSAQYVSMERSESQLLNEGFELVEGEPSADSGTDGTGSIQDFPLMDETLSDDGTEITSMLQLNSGIGEMLDNASESDAAVDEVLKPAEEITTYYSETFMVIHAFAGDSDTPVESDVVGLNAEIDESEDFEVYSEMYDEISGEFFPHTYANPAQFAVFDGMEWVDQTGAATAEEVYYGNYSNLYDAFITNSESIDISEDEDHYYLYNIGGGSVLHDNFGSIFNVEYTRADMDAMENAIIGIVDKSTGELIQIAYISTAPGTGTDEVLHIEISEIFENYGEYDESGITVPDLPESTSV